MIMQNYEVVSNITKKTGILNRYTYFLTSNLIVNVFTFTARYANGIHLHQNNFSLHKSKHYFMLCSLLCNFYHFFLGLILSLYITCAMKYEGNTFE